MITEAAFTPVGVAIGALGIAALLAWLDAVLKSKKPQLVYQATAFNKAVLSRCPTLHSVYQCTPFLTNGHVETIMVAKLRRRPGVDYKREVILTKDGGAVAIDWEHVDDQGKVSIKQSPAEPARLAVTGPASAATDGLCSQAAPSSSVWQLPLRLFAGQPSISK